MAHIGIFPFGQNPVRFLRNDSGATPRNPVPPPSDGCQRFTGRAVHMIPAA